MPPLGPGGVIMANDQVFTSDPYARLRDQPPGTYQILDTVRGLVQTIQVREDRTLHVLSSQPGPRIDVPPGAVPDLIPWQGEDVRAVHLGEQLYAPPLPEGSTMNIDRLGITHLQLVNEPTRKELEDFRLGRVSVRMLADTHTMMFLFRYGDAAGWSEASFSVHRVQVAHGAGAAVCPPDPGEGYAWLVGALLVDSSTGKVVALRQYALSRAFCLAVAREHERQRAREPSETLHSRQVARFQRRSTAALAMDAPHRFEMGRDAS
jgi:hypothetical protein